MILLKNKFLNVVRARQALMSFFKSSIPGNGSFSILSFCLFIATLSCLIFGLWGWNSLADILLLTNGDILYRSITALFLSDLFQTSSNWQHDWRINISRWSGVAAFFIGASKAITTLLQNQWSEWIAKFRSRHLVVIGNDLFSTALISDAVYNAQPVNWLTTGAVEKRNDSRLMVLGGSVDQAALSKARIHEAKRVVVSIDRDSSALALSRVLRDQHPDEMSLNIQVKIKSPWIGLHMEKVIDSQKLQLFSEAQIAVAGIQSKYPPFYSALRLKQRNIHHLVIGFNNFGESVLIETLLNNATTWLEKPRITIIDPLDKVIKDKLELRYPELDKCADIEVLGVAIGGNYPQLAESMLNQVSSQCPITASYVCLSNSDAALSSSIALSTLFARNGIKTGPIFCRNSFAKQQYELDLNESGSADGRTRSLIQFGSVDEVVKNSRISNNEDEASAKQYHEVYLTFASGDKEASEAWDNLSETYRESNRRVVRHIPAKLASLNYERLSTNPDLSCDELIRLHTEQEITEDDIEKLCDLEHQRWMIDRRLNGWRSGQRDNNRRLHPELIPFNELSRHSQSFDRNIVLASLKAAGAVNL